MQCDEVGQGDSVPEFSFPHDVNSKSSFDDSKYTSNSFGHDLDMFIKDFGLDISVSDLIKFKKYFNAILLKLQCDEIGQGDSVPEPTTTTEPVSLLQPPLSEDNAMYSVEDSHSSQFEDCNDKFNCADDFNFDEEFDFEECLTSYSQGAEIFMPQHS
jgi:hypothetical protein